MGFVCIVFIIKQDLIMQDESPFCLMVQPPPISTPSDQHLPFTTLVRFSNSIGATLVFCWLPDQRWDPPRFSSRLYTTEKPINASITWELMLISVSTPS